MLIDRCNLVKTTDFLREKMRFQEFVCFSWDFFGDEGFTRFWVMSKPSSKSCGRFTGWKAWLWSDIISITWWCQTTKSIQVSDSLSICFRPKIDGTGWCWNFRHLFDAAKSPMANVCRGKIPGAFDVAFRMDYRSCLGQLDPRNGKTSFFRRRRVWDCSLLQVLYIGIASKEHICT